MPSPDLCTQEEVQHLMHAFHASERGPGPIGPVREAQLGRRAGQLPQVP